MNKICESTGVVLVGLPYKMDPPKGTWVIIPDDDGEPSNRAIVELRGVSRVPAFYDRIHGASVMVNGDLQVVTVFGADFEADVTTGGRGSRSGRGGGPPEPLSPSTKGVGPHLGLRGGTHP